MKVKTKNWVEEFTSTVGTGSLTLIGPSTGHATFDSKCVEGELVCCTIKDGINRETGFYTFSAPNTLARTKILEKMVAGVITENPGVGLTLSGSAKVLITQSTQFLNLQRGKDLEILTANTTLVSSSNILVDTTASALTMTLPSTPEVGDKVSIGDYAGTFATNNVTVARNGSNIEGLAEDLILNTNRPSLMLEYIDATKGWIRVVR